MKEGVLNKDFMVKLSRLGHRVFRNNTGSTWIGKSKRINKPGNYFLQAGDVVTTHARRFHAGLVKGASDLIGWTSVTITPDMVGKKVALFTAIEVKTGKLKLTKEQKNFLNQINKEGGLGIMAREFADIEKGVDQWEKEQLNLYL